MRGRGLCLSVCLYFMFFVHDYPSSLTVAVFRSLAGPVLQISSKLAVLTVALGRKTPLIERKWKVIGPSLKCPVLPPSQFCPNCT